MDSPTLDAAQIKKIMERIKIMLVLKQMKEDNTGIEIIPHLFIGCLGASLNKKKLQETNIKYILSACEMPAGSPNNLVINIYDSIDTDIKSKFIEATDFIHEHVMQQENVLVHCFAGKSRSTTFIIAYLMRFHKMNPEEALALIKSKRSIAQPNAGFMKQLNEYYTELASQ